jgi:glyoxylate utilization-related uncharacterized protein
MSINKCALIQLPRISDPRGNLSFIEGHQHIPFEIRRVYYIYDVPGGSERGSHAHKNLHQFIVAISGSFDVTLHDGRSEKKFCLNRPFYGLYVCPMIWRNLENFSSGAVCMVVASEHYDEIDYIRDRHQFIVATQSQRRLDQSEDLN